MTGSLASWSARIAGETFGEVSQSAQDVVALSLLSMGLPRKPETGNSLSQPPMGEVVAAANEIVTASSYLHLVRGSKGSHPLSRLAGMFHASEVSIRGRHYDSIASRVNSKIFEDQVVCDILQSVLGFSLRDIRVTRSAAESLLNERFFGARDRVSDAFDPSSVAELRESDIFDMSTLLGECRRFGAVSVADLSARTGLAETVIGDILDLSSINGGREDCTDLLDDYLRGVSNPSFGCLADRGEYVLLNAFLAEDELRREIEAEISSRGSKNWERYVRRRARLTEACAAEALTALLGGCEPRWKGQKYLGPESIENSSDFREGSRVAALPARTYESDLLFVQDGVAFCVEVKAGSVTGKARGGDPRRLATDLEKTFTSANVQAERLRVLLDLNGGVFDDRGNWIDLSDVRELHSIVVMLDEVGPLALSMNELAGAGVISTSEIPWIVNLHDLLTMGEVRCRPAEFLCYLRRRRSRHVTAMMSGLDELDMFMWFLSGGFYVPEDPRGWTGEKPEGWTPTKAEVRRFEEHPQVQVGTFTDVLDAWMYGREGRAPEVARPQRHEVDWVEDFLEVSQRAAVAGWLRFGADLVDLREESKLRLGRDFRESRRAARGSAIEHSLTTCGYNTAGSWLLVMCAAGPDVRLDHVSSYLRDKQYQLSADRAMLLNYRPGGQLYGNLFRGEREVSSAERDEEVSGAGLHSLKGTFRPVPPSARRPTRQLRGKRKRR